MRKLLVPTVFLLGCRPQAIPLPSPTPQVTTAALNRWYVSNPDCLTSNLLHLPATLPDPDAPAPDQIDPLVAAGVLQLSGPILYHGPGVGAHLALTPLGASSWLPDPTHPGFGHLCFGAPVVQHIDSQTPRNDPAFGAVVEVEYTVTLPRPAPWATAPALQTAFPKLHLQLAQRLPGSATLKFTDNAWQVAAAPTDAMSITNQEEKDLKARP